MFRGQHITSQKNLVIAAKKKGWGDSSILQRVAMCRIEERRCNRECEAYALAILCYIFFGI